MLLVGDHQEHPLRQITLTAISPHILTSYVSGGNGKTRLRGNQIPNMGQLLKVGDAPKHAFRASPATCRAIDKLHLAMVSEGMEPLRITEAHRDAGVQAAARQGYEAWLEAGKPDPHSTAWRPGMKRDYVARPGTSNHGWGGAIDIDVEALLAPGCERGSDEALSLFWQLAKGCGLTPIIAEPMATASEAWHFDHLGPLRAVRKLYDEAAKEHSRYRGGYSHTARVGTALAGGLPQQTDAHFIQARLLIAGVWVGLVDGAIGPMTRAGLEEAGIGKGDIKKGTKHILVKLNEHEVGYKQLRKA
jgi:hypothetical protein